MSVIAHLDLSEYQAISFFHDYLVVNHDMANQQRIRKINFKLGKKKEKKISPSCLRDAEKYSV